MRASRVLLVAGLGPLASAQALNSGRVWRKPAGWVRVVCLGFALLGLSSGAAQAQVITEFSAGITAGALPDGITAGPDGNLWFTEQNGIRIGRITPLGVVTEFSAGFTAGAFLQSITAGPDGNLWFTEEVPSRIGRITPVGVVTEFSAGITGASFPYDITAGPDGNLWFTELQGNRIGRITPLGVVTEFSAGISAGAAPVRITAGPDGNLWFTEFSGIRIGRITPVGVVTEFSAGITPSAGPYGITAGPDGNLWFTEFGGDRIGRITPLGVVTEFSAGITAGATPYGITVGPDGNLWFTERGISRIGRITTGAAIAPPTIAKSFGAPNIVLNGSTSLSFTIDNPNKTTGLTGVGFTDALPAGLVVSTPNGLTGSCGGGAIVATAGSSAVSLTGAALPGSASCTFSVNVTGTTTGTKNNTTSAVTSVEGGSGGTASANLTVGCPAITLAPATVPAGTQGVAYSQTITASGGASPYSFLVISGSLPAGVTLSPAGVLAGTPTASGPFSFTIQATDTNSCTGSRAYVLSISPSSCSPPPAPSLSADPASVRLGQAVTLSWSGTIAAGQGSYTVELSINGGAFFSVGTVAASGASSESFGYAASTGGGTYDFRVLAVPACGPSSFTASNLVRVIVTGPCPSAPAVTGVVVNPQTVDSGGTFTLTWNAAASSSGTYGVFRSTDGGQTFQLLATTGGTSFTGTATDPPGTTVTFEVEVQGCVYSPRSNFATLTIGSIPCDAPGPVSNVQIRPLGGDLSRGPAPTEFFVVSWSAPAGGTPTTRFGLRINGEPEVSVSGTSVTLLPRGPKLDPIQAFVKSFGCVPEKVGPEVAGDPVALFLTPPKAQFSVSANPRANVAVVFTDTSSPQATSWLWIFDEGTTDSRQSPTHTFTIPGPHVIFLIASNGAGSTQTSQSISVGAAGMAVVMATSVVPIDSTDPGRRWARVEILGRETVLLRLQTKGSGEAIVFLRFLDSTGDAVLERRLSVRPGGETVHDLGAFGMGGTYTIELVSSQDFEPALTVAGRPGVREVSR